MQNWENILIDAEEAKKGCQYDKLEDRCRFTQSGWPGKTRIFLYIFVIVGMYYSCTNTREIRALAEAQQQGIFDLGVEILDLQEKLEELQ